MMSFVEKHTKLVQLERFHFKGCIYSYLLCARPMLGAERTEVKPTGASLVLREPMAYLVESGLKGSLQEEAEPGHGFEG